MTATRQRIRTPGGAVPEQGDRRNPSGAPQPIVSADFASLVQTFAQESVRDGAFRPKDGILLPNPASPSAPVPLLSSPPAGPTNLAVDNGADEDSVYADISWDAALDLNPGSFFEVVLVHDTDPPIVRHVTGTSIRFDNLRGVNDYTVSVYAVSHAGVRSTATSDTFTSSADTTVPADVTNVGATAGLRNIMVTWDEVADSDVANGAGMYVVELAEDSGFTTGVRSQRKSGDFTTFSDLAPDTTYYVRVKAQDRSGNLSTNWSTADSATTLLAAPADIAADAILASKLASITMEVGKYFQSSNYDGTDVATGDATTGFRIEASGKAEFSDVRVRGEIHASRFSALDTSGVMGDGTFETSTEGWTAITSPTTVTRSSTHARDGSWSLALTKSSASGRTDAISDHYPITPGFAYEVTVDLRQASHGLVATGAFVIFSDAAGDPIFAYTMDLDDGEVKDVDTWGRWRLKCIAPEDLGLVSLEVAILGNFTNTNTGTTYVDNVRVREVPALEGAVYRSSANADRVEIADDRSIKFLYDSVSTVEQNAQIEAYTQSRGDAALERRILRASSGVFLGGVLGRHSADITLESSTPTIPGSSRSTAYIEADRVMIGNVAGGMEDIVPALRGWKSYTPQVLQPGPIACTVTYAKYMQIGRTVFCNVAVVLTAAGTGDNAIGVTIPVTAAVASNIHVGSGFVFDASVLRIYEGAVRLASTTFVAFNSADIANPNYNFSGQSTNTPMAAALASGDEVQFSICYEAA